MEYDQLDELALEHGINAVASVHRGAQEIYAQGFGLADHATMRKNTPATRFQLASGAKTFTSLAALSLVDEGRISLEISVREVLGSDLSEIADDVTIEHLLNHRSGISDYLAETDDWDPNDYMMQVPVHTLWAPESYLPALAHTTQVETPGEAFRYNNAGYVILAIIIERTAQRSYYDVVAEICEKVGIQDTRFERNDEPRENSATGYIATGDLASGAEDTPWRTNVLHLPVRGCGDGGITSTAADIHQLWRACYEGKVLSSQMWLKMITPQGVDPDEDDQYGIGVWINPHTRFVSMEGMDAGISMRSTHDPSTKTTVTVLSNTADGAWPLFHALRGALPEAEDASPAGITNN